MKKKNEKGLAISFKYGNIWFGPIYYDGNNIIESTSIMYVFSNVLINYPRGKIIDNKSNSESFFYTTRTRPFISKTALVDTFNEQNQSMYSIDFNCWLPKM